MPNIYIKVPTYVAQFFRSRDVNNPLTEFQPVKFSPFQAESVIMSTWLMTIDENLVEHGACFSQRQWLNMLRGQPPQGGVTIIRREPTDWLTMEEVITLSHEKRNGKTDGMDYLCVEAPRSVLVGQRYKEVTPSFALPYTASCDIVRRMRQEFIRVFVEWMRKEMAYCDIQGIQRDVQTCVDHFFYHYNMNLGANGADRDSMRRMAKRWMEDSKVFVNSVTDEDVLFVYKNERDNRKLTLNDMLMELT